jgi:hypothetical protein
MSENIGDTPGNSALAEVRQTSLLEGLDGLDSSIAGVPADFVPGLLVQNYEPINVQVPDGFQLGCEQDHVIALTRSAIGYYRSATLSAAAMCITFYYLYQAFAKATHQPASDRLPGGKRVHVYGWSEWVSANFEGLGLSRGNISNAIRSGAVLLHVMKDKPDAAKQLSKLSRAAIFALGLGGSSTEIATEVAVVLEQGQEVTAKKITEMRQAMERLQAENSQLSEEARSHGKVQERISQQLLDAEQLTIELRERNADLERKAKTPVESVVHKLPPGAHSEQEAIEKLRAEKQHLERETSQAAKKVDELKTEAQLLERRAEASRQSDRTISSLKHEVGQVMLKYGGSLLESLSASSSATRTELKDIAASLRAWANTMDPA